MSERKTLPPPLPTNVGFPSIPNPTQRAELGRREVAILSLILAGFLTVAILTACIQLRFARAESPAKKTNDLVVAAGELGTPKADRSGEREGGSSASEAGTPQNSISLPTANDESGLAETKKTGEDAGIATQKVSDGPVREADQEDSKETLAEDSGDANSKELNEDKVISTNLTGSSRESELTGSSRTISTGVSAAGRLGASNRGVNPFEIPQGVGSVVYVIDSSGSMQGDERFNRVKYELIGAVELLPMNSSFEIILFSDAPSPLFGGKLTNASNTVKSKCIEQLNTAVPSGGTEPFSAIELALFLEPELIIVLSDGEFSPLVVNQITNLNHRSRTIRIDCVGLAESVSTLQDLSHQNGPGVYYQAQ